MTEMKLLDELSSAVISSDVKITCRLTELLLNNGVPADIVLETILKTVRVLDDKYTRKSIS